ncbi:hypothetical protein [Sporosarcina sp. SAFN-015]|uniref:hypothetical protein n=1 Tax=Sporosarcina sp. SAFN-015 TaxID=3387274 RepID=UPI003F7F4E46
MTIKITQAQVTELFFEEEIEVDGVTLTTVEEGDFEQDGKMQSAELIFTDGTKFYRGTVMRSGSPFTDWYYDEDTDFGVDEVVKKEVTITRWVAV